MSELDYLDAAAVFAALAPADAVNAITGAIRSGFDPASDFVRRSINTSQGQFLLMPSEVGSYAGVKVATVAPHNPAAGLPRIQASYVLFDAETLSLRAVLDGTALTTLRTPAVSIAAIRPALSRVSTPARIVVFGAGPQALAHVETLAAVLGLPPAPVTFVVRHPERAAEAVRARGQVLSTTSGELAALLATADVVVCATSAREPLFTADAVSPNAIVIAVGSHEPDARELDGALLRSASVVVEDFDTALREAGDVILAHKEGSIRTSELLLMKNVITGANDLDPDRRVVFKSVGMSWQDLTIAAAVVSGAGDSVSQPRKAHTPAVPARAQ